MAHAIATTVFTQNADRLQLILEEFSYKNENSISIRQVLKLAYFYFYPKFGVQCIKNRSLSPAALWHLIKTFYQSERDELVFRIARFACNENKQLEVVPFKPWHGEDDYRIVRWLINALPEEDASITRPYLSEHLALASVKAEENEKLQIEIEQARKERETARKKTITELIAMMR